VNGVTSVGRRLLVAGAFSMSAAFGACAQTDHAQAGLTVEPLEIVTSHGPVRFQVEMADTEQKREIGMMFRTSVAPDRGMLFEFPHTEPASFWMKNTLIPLDIIFIGADGHILNIATGKPQDETPIQSHGFSRGVLEIAGGRAAELGIEPGDKVEASIFPK
jgi:uncharacterized membrane protein (UPF0127 family)